MTPQLVDFNADGYNDMVMATFEGHVFVVKGSKDGYEKPIAIKDKNGNNIRISMYWDDEKSDYLEVDRSIEGEKHESGHHLTSACAVDWDNDDDLDLLLGAYEGALYWCENEGDKSTPKFADKNRQVRAAGKHMTIPDGLATPVVADFDRDGLFDIVCGGAKGGVYLFKNTGKIGNPKFAGARVLIEKTIGKTKDPESAEIEDYFTAMRVPSKNGLPTCPGTSFHIDVVDYDSDGHLDILIGGQSHIKEELKKLSTEEEKELRNLRQRVSDSQKKVQELFKDKTQEELQKLFESESFQELENELTPIWERIYELEPPPSAKEYVWFYRNQGKTRTETTAEKTTDNGSDFQFESKTSPPAKGKLSMIVDVSEARDFAKSRQVILKLEIQVPAGYHIYGSKDPNAPSTITITEFGGLQGEKHLKIPAGKLNMSKGAAQYWLEGKIKTTHVFALPSDSKGGTLKGKLDYMICDDKMCLPPDSFEFSVEISRASKTSQN